MGSHGVDMAFPVNDFYTVGSGLDMYTGNALPPSVAHVFIESGQSNCHGRGLRVDAPVGSDPGPIGNIKTWRRSQDGDMYSGTGAWHPLDYEWNNYEGLNTFGSVLQFGLEINASLGSASNDIYIIKADSSGKPIPGWINGGAESVAMYSGHITPALADLVADPTYDEIRIHGFFWDQGESDTNIEGLADAYNANLTQLKAELRAAVGILDLPFIIRKLDTNVLTTPFRDTVIAAQVAVAGADSDAYLLEGPYTYLGDNLHIDGDGQNAVGTDRHTLITSITNGTIYNA